MEGKYGGVVVSMSGFDLKLGSSQGCEFLKIFFLCATPPPIINQSSPSPPQKKKLAKMDPFPRQNNNNLLCTHFPTKSTHLVWFLCKHL